jgi:hypothetical protein
VLAFSSIVVITLGASSSETISSFPIAKENLIGNVNGSLSGFKQISKSWKVGSLIAIAKFTSSPVSLSRFHVLK